MITWILIKLLQFRIRRAECDIIIRQAYNDMIVAYETAIMFIEAEQVAARWEKPN